MSFHDHHTIPNLIFHILSIKRERLSFSLSLFLPFYDTTTSVYTSEGVLIFSQMSISSWLSVSVFFFFFEIGTCLSFIYTLPRSLKFNHQFFFFFFPYLLSISTGIVACMYLCRYNWHSLPLLFDQFSSTTSSTFPSTHLLIVSVDHETCPTNLYMALDDHPLCISPYPDRFFFYYFISLLSSSD